MYPDDVLRQCMYRIAQADPAVMAWWIAWVDSRTLRLCVSFHEMPPQPLRRMAQAELARRGAECPPLLDWSQRNNSSAGRRPYHIVFRGISSATDQRTSMATILPGDVAISAGAPVIRLFAQDAP